MLTRKVAIAEVKEELKQPLKQGTPLSVEAMRLMVHVESRRREKKGEPPLNCFVINGDNKEEFANLLESMKKQSVDLEHPVRFQVVVRKGAHYTAIDFKLSKEGNEYFMLDAANDPRGLMRANMLSAMKGSDDEPFFNAGYIASGSVAQGGNIQKDFHSCPAFSLDHVCQVSKIEDIYDTLKEKATKGGVVEWQDLPPALVWNVQSLSWVEAYKNKQLEFISTAYREGQLPASMGETVDSALTMLDVLDDHVKSGEKTVLVGGQEKKANGSIEKVFGEHQSRAQAYVQRHSTNTLEAIIHPTAAIQLDQPKLLTSGAHIMKTLIGGSVSGENLGQMAKNLQSKKIANVDVGENTSKSDVSKVEVRDIHPKSPSESSPESTSERPRIK